jgi:hypothetical protein
LFDIEQRLIRPAVELYSWVVRMTRPPTVGGQGWVNAPLAVAA